MSARDSALEILRREYESAKARIRKCREEHKSARRTSVASNESQEVIHFVVVQYIRKLEES